MHIRGITLLVLQGALALSLPSVSSVGDSTTLEAMHRLSELAKKAYQKAQEDSISPGNLERRHTTCSWKDVKVRREWGALSKQERLDYTKAVNCLLSKPPNYPAALVPGGRSRFDDFVAVHINQTLTIHSTGNFLSWHRYFTWLYEKALQDECGYKGTQPYWDWAITASTGFASSPIFDGSETSMSGNGAPIPNQGPVMIVGDNNTADAKPPILLPPGSGGGCITSGPFVNMSVNLGPVALDVPGGLHFEAPTGNPLDYNPRCLKRDLTDEINQSYVNATSILNNILLAQDIFTFQKMMQSPAPGKLGIHGGGHYSLGGDPGRDFYVSPAEPVFYLHHANIDRVWWIWQMLDEENRVWSEKGALSGTNTFHNRPPSANTTFEDWVQFEHAAPGMERQLKELMSTRGGSPFCYVYL